MASHAAGGGLGLIMLLSCVIVAAYHRNIAGIVTGCIYGCSILLLFTMSSIYHGLKHGTAKRVFQVLDHCMIYLMIAGTYTPVLLCAYRLEYPASAFSILGIVWGLAALGITLTSIDLQKFRKIAMGCYLGMGWCIVFQLRRMLGVYGTRLFVLLLIGGVLYTGGVVFYAIGGKKKYMHSVFHIFVNVATVLQFFGIVVYVMPGPV
ncbi:MAG: hemolysin III family protein [Clostridia bacterium]|nr:hemolysin III family protein [Clostridia bacterium]